MTTPADPEPLGGRWDSQLPTTSQRAAVTAILAAIPMAAVAHTLDYRLIAVNDDCATLLKVPREDVAGLPVRNFIPVADLHSALETARVAAELSSTAARPATALRRLIDGEGRELTCWMHVGLATIGGYRCFVACIDLVDPVLSDAHRWRHRAEHDELTGLARRGTLLTHLAQLLTSGLVVMLAFLDIDNFKLINDTHGHAAGDQVLTALARRLEQHAPKGCFVSRLAGDEFVLALVVPAGGARPAALDQRPVEQHSFDHRHGAAADTLRAVGDRCVAEPVAWGDHLLMLSISVGVTISRPAEDPADLLSRAYKAIYAQKAHGGRRVH